MSISTIYPQIYVHIHSIATNICPYPQYIHKYMSISTVYPQISIKYMFISANHPSIYQYRRTLLHFSWIKVNLESGETGIYTRFVCFLTAFHRYLCTILLFFRFFLYNTHTILYKSLQSSFFLYNTNTSTKILI